MTESERPEPISWTIRLDCPIPQLRGKRVEGGRPGSGRQLGDFVAFETLVEGKSVTLRVASNPGLDAAVRAYREVEAEISARRQVALEAAVPGATAVLESARLAREEDDRYEIEFERMMADEDNDGVRPPRPRDRSYGDRLAELLAAYPRAAMYLRATRQMERDNWRLAAAGEACRSILEAGGSLQDAEAALHVEFPPD